MNMTFTQGGPITVQKRTALVSKEKLKGPFTYLGNFRVN